jgi:hypothetical protein
MDIPCFVIPPCFLAPAVIMVFDVSLLFVRFAGEYREPGVD